MKGALRNGHVQPIFYPLGSSSKRTVLGTPTGEEAPQGLRGWGVRLRGSRGRVPLVGCGAKPQGFYHAMA
ncbi:hypothetical protein BK769_29285 [Bacillus thuringiensis serovar kumamtoensis]|uniref:Uncharacterized protein n=1 Tax=Bacillus thuringiensis serovar kumamotoensis TaxID=132267 RepID=A0A9X6PNG2_BACUK|nr:hypothetical protein BK769_29285 [Bacillus thuringiensis serovar kumamtoensis]